MNTAGRGATLLAAVLAIACARAPEPDSHMLSVWVKTWYGAIRVERLSPPVASRIVTYATSALYSGLAAADPSIPSLHGVLNGFPELPRPEGGRRYDGTLAAVAAERVVMDSLFREALPTTRAALARLADSLDLSRVAAETDSAIQQRSRDLGRGIGLAIVAWSRTDGFDSTRGRTYQPPKGPGLWVNDAPASIFASQNLSGASDFVALDNPANLMQSGNASDRSLVLNRPKRAGLATMAPVNMSGMSEPYWGMVRPFALSKWNECPVEPPPAFAVDSAAVLRANARMVYEARKALTPEHREIALYWADNAGESGTPVGHWISIASQMISEKQLNTATAARLLVLTAAAQADAFIASWGYKYQYNLLRPRAYIRTVLDSTWEPLIPTPPFPEYPSGHSTQSAAAAVVISEMLGDIAFEDSTSITIGHKVRRFDSFTKAAQEAGMSRIYGGIHFPIGNESGQQLGRCIGQKAVERSQAKTVSR